jgi:rRNA maturation endonuclease Nob1
VKLVAELKDWVSTQKKEVREIKKQQKAAQKEIDKAALKVQREAEKAQKKLDRAEERERIKADAKRTREALKLSKASTKAFTDEVVDASITKNQELLSTLADSVCAEVERPTVTEVLRLSTGFYEKPIERKPIVLEENG